MTETLQQLGQLEELRLSISDVDVLESIDHVGSLDR